MHALLRHLEAVGFEGAPRVLGIDDQGREILSFISGETAAPFDDEALAAVAGLVRRYHDASASFRATPGARWQLMVGAPRGGEVICHNDLSPHNSVVGADGPRAFLDWDLAAPGSRAWDLAYALWRFVPLYADDDCQRLGFAVRPRGPRIRLFCDAYGLDERRGLMGVVRDRQLSLYRTARDWGTAGLEGWADVWRDTRGEQWLRSVRYLDANRDTWERALVAS